MTVIQEANNPKLSDYKIYIHRERGFVYIKPFSNMSYTQILNVKIDGFSFLPNRQPNNEKFGQRISICNLEGEVFAGINIVSGKVFFDTTIGLQKTLDKLLESLRKAGYVVADQKINYGYVEICARFPFEKVENSYELLERMKTIFRTKKTSTIKKSHDSLKGDWLYLVKNLLFGRYAVNVKVYLAVKFENEKCNYNLIKGIDYSRLPKIEVQITKPKNLNIAIREAVPIIIAVLKNMDCVSGEMVECDYELVRFVNKNAKGYQQIYMQMANSFQKDKLVFFDANKLGKHAEKIISMLYEKPRSVKEIKQILEVSENTARKELNRLKGEKIVYSRGRSGIEAMYAIRLQGSIG